MGFTTTTIYSITQCISKILKESVRFKSLFKKRELALDKEIIKLLNSITIRQLSEAEVPF